MKRAQGEWACAQDEDARARDGSGHGVRARGGKEWMRARGKRYLKLRREIVEDEQNAVHGAARRTRSLHDIVHVRCAVHIDEMAALRGKVAPQLGVRVAVVSAAVRDQQRTLESTRHLDAVGHARHPPRFARALLSRAKETKGLGGR